MPGIKPGMTGTVISVHSRASRNPERYRRGDSGFPLSRGRTVLPLALSRNSREKIVQDFADIPLHIVRPRLAYTIVPLR